MKRFVFIAEFMKKIIMLTALFLTNPLLAKDLTDVSQLDKRIKVDMKYHSSDNFMGRPLQGYTQNTCWLTSATAQALTKVQADLAEQGLGLKMFDCYRPQEAVDDMYNEIVKHQGANLVNKFIPNINKAELIHLGFVAKQSKHTQGNTVDLTLVDLKTQQELDMGTFFDLFDSKSWTASKAISLEAQKNRQILMDAMAKQGFKNYAKEWWHFSL